MINAEHKDRLFCFIFGREENRHWTLSLYNAVNHSSHTDPDLIEITTMDDVLYMGMKNDVSFIISNTMSIYEQQSTYNPNMPLRELMYTARLYDKYVHANRLNIYGSTLIPLPIPKLVVFYNGKEQREDQILRLEDAFYIGRDGSLKDTEQVSDITVRVRMLNINYGQNKALLDACRPLAEYAWLIDQIRSHARDMSIDNAVDHAISSMPVSSVLRPFLIGNRAEVKQMCITEYNEAETMQLFREQERREGHREGLREGRQEGIRGTIQILRGLGLSDPQIKSAIMQQYDLSDETADDYIYR